MANQIGPRSPHVYHSQQPKRKVEAVSFTAKCEA